MTGTCLHVPTPDSPSERANHQWFIADDNSRGSRRRICSLGWRLALAGRPADKARRRCTRSDNEWTRSDATISSFGTFLSQTPPGHSVKLHKTSGQTSPDIWSNVIGHKVKLLKTSRQTVEEFQSKSYDARHPVKMLNETPQDVQQNARKHLIKHNRTDR